MVQVEVILSSALSSSTQARWKGVDFKTLDYESCIWLSPLCYSILTSEIHYIKNVERFCIICSSFGLIHSFGKGGVRLGWHKGFCFEEAFSCSSVLSKDILLSATLFLHWLIMFIDAVWSWKQRLWSAENRPSFPALFTLYCTICYKEKEGKRYFCPPFQRCRNLTGDVLPLSLSSHSVRFTDVTTCACLTFSSCFRATVGNKRLTILQNKAASF